MTATRAPVCFEDLGSFTEVYEERVLAGDYSGALFTVSRPYRFAQFEFWWEYGHLSLDQMRELLPEVWEDVEGVHGAYRRALRLFRAAGFVTNAPEVWATLPDSLEVWRGTNHLRPKGLSWTLDRDRAVWFARRFASLYPAAYLVHGRILKRHVFALCHERGEDEIVVNPAKLRLLGVSNALATEEDETYQRVTERMERHNEEIMARYRRSALLRELGELLEYLPNQGSAVRAMGEAGEGVKWNAISH